MLHSVLLEIGEHLGPRQAKASHWGVKRTVQNPRNFHIFLHSFTLADYAENEDSNINILESPI
jgi:hypothetical protein